SCHRDLASPPSELRPSCLRARFTLPPRLPLRLLSHPHPPTADLPTLSLHDALPISKPIPKKGILFSRAKRIASIFPSIPRLPNPPGTTIPSTFANASWIVSRFNCSELIQ